MKKSIFFLLLSFMVTSQAGEFIKVCRGIFPENSMRIPVNGVHVSNMTQLAFDEVLNRLEKIYTPEIAARGGKFVIERLWSDPTVNAYADQDAGVWAIHMFGGMARHPKLSGDGFALVACHEIGHHLGGAPKFSDADWASIEGEADYYATLKCARRLFELDDNDKILAGMQLDPTAVATCAQEFGGKLDQQLCIRAAMASLSLGIVAAELEGIDTVPTLTTPDRSVVKSMYTDHPHAQCRVDTYYGGALCRVPAAQQLSDTDYHSGACADPNTYAHGDRPLCWFAP